MVNPQVNPQVAAAAKQVGEYVAAVISKERGKHRFSVEFVARKPPEELRKVNLDLDNLVDQMVMTMGTQLYTFLGVGGEIRDVE